jgi:hypothetical protein
MRALDARADLGGNLERGKAKMSFRERSVADVLHAAEVETWHGESNHRDCA